MRGVWPGEGRSLQTRGWRIRRLQRYNSWRFGVQLSAVVLGLRRESHAPQCGRLVIAVEEEDIIQEGVDESPTKLNTNIFEISLNFSM